jgi:hypothetical protein
VHTPQSPGVDDILFIGTALFQESDLLTPGSDKIIGDRKNFFFKRGLFFVKNVV